VKQVADSTFAPHRKEELYDLKKDPDQLHNVAGDPTYAETTKKLRRQLQVELVKSNDPRMAVTDDTNQSTAESPRK